MKSLSALLTLLLYLIGSHAWAQTHPLAYKDHVHCQNKAVAVPLFQLSVSAVGSHCILFSTQKSLDYIKADTFPGDPLLTKIPRTQKYMICLNDHNRDSFYEELNEVGFQLTSYHDSVITDELTEIKGKQVKYQYRFSQKNLKSSDILHYVKIKRRFCQTWTTNRNFDMQLVSEKEFWPESAHSQYQQSLSNYESLLDILDKYQYRSNPTDNGGDEENFTEEPTSS